MKNSGRNAIIIADLGFGDSGKGTITDFLVREHNVHTVVRYNGGPQAAHNVMTDDGRHHTFAQFGSGTFVPNTMTHISKYTLVDPLRLADEEQHLQRVGISDAYLRLTISSHAPVITPFQRAANRLREIYRDKGRHGSCGMGVGETAEDARNGIALRAGDLRVTPRELRAKLSVVQIAKRAVLGEIIKATRDFPEARPEIELLESHRVLDDLVERYVAMRGVLQIIPDTYFERMLSGPGTVLFEGAQGVLLDKNFGFYPHITRSSTTTKNADAMLRDAQFTGNVSRIGVLRAYMTRHGNGPFVSESHELGEHLPDMHNDMSPWQGRFRVGWLDLVALRYALSAARNIDSLAVTCIDRLAEMDDWKACTAYKIVGKPDDRCVIHFEQRDERTITGINVGEKPLWSHQEQLTRLLQDCAMSCENLGSEQGLLEKIEQVARIPVRIISKSPTASGKQMLQPLEI